MFRKILMALPIVLLSVQYGAAAIQPKIKVACVGNSITFGAGLSNQARDSYPSPVKILRNKDFISNINGIYPCGEGAGYAGRYNVCFC